MSPHIGETYFCSPFWSRKTNPYQACTSEKITTFSWSMIVAWSVSPLAHGWVNCKEVSTRLNASDHGMKTLMGLCMAHAQCNSIHDSVFRCLPNVLHGPKSRAGMYQQQRAGVHGCMHMPYLSYVKADNRCWIAIVFSLQRMQPLPSCMLSAIRESFACILHAISHVSCRCLPQSTES